MMILRIITACLLSISLAVGANAQNSLPNLPQNGAILQEMNFDSEKEYVLIFDEPIKSYSFSKPKLIRAEVLTNISNDRKKLLVRPCKAIENVLTVVFASGIRLISIKFDNLTLGGSSSHSLQNFELDQPPELTKR